MSSILVACLMALFASPESAPGATAIHFRYNQLGYLTADQKTALVIADGDAGSRFEVWDERANALVFEGALEKPAALPWGNFSHCYQLDFSALKTPGTYYLKIRDTRSAGFSIGQAYQGLTRDLLTFMQQQRCGYNPFLDMVCHKRDGRAFYGAVPDSTYVDVSGGWHDAGDQLKYLITSSFATGSMLLAYELFPAAFDDEVNHLGQAGSNGRADVLDEARWGLDWIHRCYAAPGQLVHQVADDRDHSGWKWPDQDPADFGWGPNSYRAAYFANGQPQGLKKYKSKATGIANVAGRSAAAMAIGYRMFKKEDPAYAAKCLKAASELYEMGRAKEGYQQGNSYGAPYRYNEDTWTDDMEWAAAELYKVTQESQYLEQAKHYARLTATNGSWMPLDTADHYRLYPFVNLGHFALYQSADAPFRDTLAGYYRQGIEDCLQRGQKNMYQVGVPFIWCSNNLVTALITQIILYERMTGDLRYHGFLLAQRDWLFGHNPWGTSMFTGIPRNGEYPDDVHTSVWAMTGRMVPGGLLDGPVYATIFDSLLGLEMTEPDEFAAFQNSFVVYHDDIGDYSTNEPTMDGTAGAILGAAYFEEKEKKQ